jgi:pimeloyl-ACP methyl ester carboxylesterase
MRRIPSPSGVSVSYDRYGSGPPLVLVHGGFSDHRTNWELVKPLLETQFTVYAIARRGRGETDATQGHRLEDEGQDVVAVIQSVGAPVFLLGHSYGAQAALVAAAAAPAGVRKLVLYEPPWPRALGKDAVARLEDLARAGDWDGLAVTFFRDTLSVPQGELDALRATGLWPPIVADARASLEDVRALTRYDFKAERFGDLRLPVLLQIGTESPRDLYVTDALAAVLPDVRVEELPGQAHEGMTTAPEMYARAVARFLLSPAPR